MRFFQIKTLNLCTLFIIASCSSEEETCSYVLDQVYEGQELGFTITFPNDYYLEVNQESLHLSAIKPTEDTTYLEGIGITVGENVLNYRLNEFYKAAKFNDQEDFTDSSIKYSLSDEGSEIINDSDVRWNIYRYDNEVALTYFYVENGMTYRMLFLTYSNYFDSLRCKFEQIANTVEFNF